MTDSTRPGRSRRPLSLGRRVAFTAVMFGFFLVGLEGFFQILAYATPDQTHYADVDQLPDPDAAALRVLAVGDSWVYGAESLPQEAFIEVFAEELRASSGQAVQVFNLGVSGSNSAQALWALYNAIQFVRPQYVVALTGNNNQLHDKKVREAATLIGESPEMQPGIPWLEWSRLYLAVKALKVQLTPVELDAEPVGAAYPDLLGAKGTDPTGSAGLPSPPPKTQSTVFRLPWWDLYVQRRWDHALTLLESSKPDPNSPAADDPVYKGVTRAWEALLLAHLGKFDEAEQKATEALRLPGDHATPWEARAVIAEQTDRPMHALQHRFRAAAAPADARFPWIADRARGRALLELEAWEAADVWLMGAQMAVPGNLEVLTGLARLSGATRGEDVEDALSVGPRGMVTATEYFDWHLVSSGMVDRAVSSLGDVDPDESAHLEVYRGRAAALLEQPDDAQRWFAGVLARDDARPIDRDRAVAGLIGLAADPAQFEALLGVAPKDLPVTPSNAGPLVSFFRTHGDCEAAVRTGQAGLAQGMAAIAFERAASDCLERTVGWSLTEQALAAGPVLERSALVLGDAPGTTPGPVARPDVAEWDAFAERRFVDFARANGPDWQALAYAHLGDATKAGELLEQAADGGDPAVLAYARGLLERQAGRWLPAFLQMSAAATAEDGDPWVRATARGIVLATALKWKAAQRELLASLRVAPGYLEALEVLAEVPQGLRYPATELALRYVPTGYVPAHRWSAWYRAQARIEEAQLALAWPVPLTAPRPGDDVRNLLARGRLLAADGDGEGARAAFADAADLAAEAGDVELGCRALAARVGVFGKETAGAEVAALTANCPTHPEALAIAGSIAALHADCEETTSKTWAALEAGADPGEVVDWMEPCVAEQELDAWMEQEARKLGLPDEVAGWLRHRVHPGQEDEPVPTSAPDRRTDLLVKHLDAMARLADEEEARFVALTYPFPGAHHQKLRDKLVAAEPGAAFELLDLYAHFERTYSAAQWGAMRTPGDHVNASGYAEMGRRLHQHLAGSAPPPAP
jgi:tetratricopeptide (TPR) repeat protein